MKSGERTPAQTEAVKFWSQPNIGAAWQDAARDLSAAKKLGLAENARLFALLNMGVANTFITDWDAKFTYNFWRPLTAIRNGDRTATTRPSAMPAGRRSTPPRCTPNIRRRRPSSAGVSVGVLEAVFGAEPPDPLHGGRRCDPELKRPLREHRADLPASTATCASGAASTSGTRSRSASDMGRKIAAYLVENALKPAR